MKISGFHIRKIVVESLWKSKECENTEVMFLCLHCGKCGRVFENGICVNIEEYPPEGEDDE